MAAGDDHTCRFGFIPASDSLVLSAKKKKEDNEIIHIFRTGANECKDCRNLNGTEISQEEWANKEKMKENGFPFTENGQYVPHPHCKCHWEEKIKSNDAEGEKTDSKRTVESSIISDKKHIEPKLKVMDASAPENIEPSVAVEKHPGIIKFAAPKEIVETKNNPEKSKYAALLPHTYGFLSPENASSHDRQQAYMRAAPRFFDNSDEHERINLNEGPYFKRGKGHSVIGIRGDTATILDRITDQNIFDGVDDLIRKLEKQKYRPHSVDNLIIIGHGGGDNDYKMGSGELEQLDSITDEQVRKLKNFLHADSVVDIRMCRAASGAEGKRTAQMLANKLGCTVIAYEGYVSRKGGPADYIFPWNAPELSPRDWIRPPYKEKEFRPQGVDKTK